MPLDSMPRREGWKSASGQRNGSLPMVMTCPSCDIVHNDLCPLSLQERTQQWNNRLSLFGLRLNVNKTEYLESGVHSSISIHAHNIELKKVSQVKYLGSLISVDGEFLPEVSKELPLLG